MSERINIGMLEEDALILLNMLEANANQMKVRYQVGKRNTPTIKWRSIEEDSPEYVRACRMIEDIKNAWM